MLAYRLFIWLYPRAVWLLSFWNPKARAWRRGRKSIFKQLSAAFHRNTKPVIWMHCSSLGEFEQGLPILESLKTSYSGYKILVTFFSPSGYEVRKDHPVADFVYYLPMDGPSRANRFFNIVQPSLVLFVKYEFWYFYLQEAAQRNIPAVLVSGIFRPDQPFFKWYGNLHRQMLSFFARLFVQTNEAASLLRGIGVIDSVVVTGDTRFDRVIEIAGDLNPVPEIEAFCSGRQTVIAGSTWTEDDEELDHFANTHPEMRFIIAPHDLDKERLEECLSLYKHSMLYSVFINQTALPTGTNTLIIDNMGMLSRLYRYATICYVGGGFGDDGIHNVLEAAVYNKPVVFGPEYDKYIEGEELVDCGGGFSIENALGLEALLQDLLTNTDKYNAACGAAGNYVRGKAGATEKVVNYIQENRLLIN